MAEQVGSNDIYTPLSTEAAERAASLLVEWMSVTDASRGTPMTQERAEQWRGFLAEGFAAPDHSPGVLERLRRDKPDDVAVVRARAALAYAFSRMVTNHAISNRSTANAEDSDVRTQ